MPKKSSKKKAFAAGVSIGSSAASGGSAAVAPKKKTCEPIACNVCFSSDKPLFVVACDACHAAALAARDRDGFDVDTERCETCIAALERRGIDANGCGAGAVCCGSEAVLAGHSCGNRVNVSRRWSAGWSWLPERIAAGNGPPLIVIPLALIIYFQVGALMTTIFMPWSERFWHVRLLFVVLVSLCVILQTADAISQRKMIVRLHHWMLIGVFSGIQVILTIFMELRIPWYVLDDPEEDLHLYKALGLFLLAGNSADILYYAWLTYSNGVMARFFRALIPVRCSVSFRPAHATSAIAATRKTAFV